MAWDILKYVAGSAHGLGYGSQISSGLKQVNGITTIPLDYWVADCNKQKMSISQAMCWSHYIFEHIPSQDLIPLHIWAYPKPWVDPATYLSTFQAMIWSCYIFEYIPSQMQDQLMAWDIPKYVAGSAHSLGYAQICSGISSWLGIYQAKNWSRYIFEYIPSQELIPLHICVYPKPWADPATY
jgi:hypothetical protein